VEKSFGAHDVALQNGTPDARKSAIYAQISQFLRVPRRMERKFMNELINFLT
jgi:hypothetical protein